MCLLKFLVTIPTTKHLSLPAGRQGREVMGRIGITEVIFILLVIVLLFGTKRLPEIGSALGKAIREFKRSSKEVEDEVKKAVSDTGHESKSS